MNFASVNDKTRPGMKRINREFCLTDESVNCYGYRLLTSGLEIDRYRPPVGFLMHEREKGVAVMWTDFRIEGDRLYATPVVNDTLFPTLAQQIEEGFINAASVGHIVALEQTDDPTRKLPGQDGPTVTRWFPREVSLVDIPGNYNALGRLYDENDNVLHDLAARPSTTKTPYTMDFSDIFPDLAAPADEATLRPLLLSLKERADKAQALEDEILALRAETARAEARDLASKAVEAHKVTRPVADRLLADYDGRPEALAALLDLFPARKAAPQPEPQQGSDLASNLTWDELDHRGLLPRLKAENPDLFAAKFAQRFGRK